MDEIEVKRPEHERLGRRAKLSVEFQLTPTLKS
jgi:hypothetical protein